MPVIKNPTTIIKSGGGEDKLAYRISSLGNYSYENNEITDLKRSAFSSDANLTEIRCDNVLSIGNSAFIDCASLTSASFSSATSIGNSAFYNCILLGSILFPLVTSIGGDAFNGCFALLFISFSSATSIGNSAFYNCTGLRTASFSSATSIGRSAFYGCSHLTSITLGNTSQVCTLSATNAIPATSSHHVNIYVPVNLVASYRTATNWSTLYNNGYISFLPIDGQLINTSITNGTFSGPVAIANNGTATVTLSANSGYELPSTITVTGASYTYNQSTGVVSLSNPTAEVYISCVCQQATPSGYNLTITSGGSIGYGSDSNAYVKLNGYATRASDYDYYIVGEGLYGTPSSIYNKEGVLQSNPLNLTQISSIQIWGDSICEYEFNSGDATDVSGGFNNRVMINLTQDSTIEIAPYIED